jgi:hypothetical protein
MNEIDPNAGTKGHLKQLGRTVEELRNEIRIVKTISKDIKMELGLEKCARFSLESGKVLRKQHVGNKMRIK